MPSRSAPTRSWKTITTSILRLVPSLAAAWPNRNIAVQWLTLYPHCDRRTRQPLPITEAQVEALAGNSGRIEQLRNRLSNLSWSMGRLNEFVARVANKKDAVKARFRESRFKCQALLDEAAIAACMVYVDLNPTWFR